MAGSLNKDVCFRLASCVKQGIVLENEPPPYIGKKKIQLAGELAIFQLSLSAVFYPAIRIVVSYGGKRG